MPLEDIFPYTSFRQGQRELAHSVYLACKKGDRFVAEAMSGFGKTAAVLAGSILAATEDDLNIVYACRTKRQVFRVMEELKRFSKRVPIRATSLFSKYDYCLLRQHSHVLPETFKWYCSFQTSNNLCTYFMNVPFRQREILRIAEDYVNLGSTSDLLQKGTSLHICPYEVARASLASSRIIVTTYHYLLDPQSRPVILTGGFESPKNVIGVIDEAHNIRDFISGNSTTSLSFADMDACLVDAKKLFLDRVTAAVAEFDARARSFLRWNDHWLVEKHAFVKAVTGPHQEDWLPDLAFELSAMAGVAWYSVATGRNLPPSLSRFGAFLSRLLSSLEDEDVVLSKSDGELFLTDTSPSKAFIESTEGLRSLIMLSATINPSLLFLRSIGLDGSATVHTATTENLFRIKTIIDTGVSTRFRLRSDEMFERISQRIAAICGAVSGGIGIFAPSYLVLGRLEQLLTKVVNDRRILLERAGLTNEESDSMMETFKSTPGCVLLAVQGGHFSEGEDFPGDDMDVSVVVGLSLPPPSPTMYAEYKNLKGFQKGEGYLLLSLLPALRKAFQCAGRHVRDPGKVGMVFFLDSRFAQPSIVELMPSWLRENLSVGDFPPNQVTAMTREFFLSSSSASSPALR